MSATTRRRPAGSPALMRQVSALHTRDTVAGGRLCTPEDHPEILAAATNDLLPPADAQAAQLPNSPLES